MNRSGKDLTLQKDLSSPREFEIAIKEIRRRAGRDGIHLVAGGPPCQGFSTAGDCRLTDPRNQLVYAFLDAVTRLEPKYALMENVPALTYRGRARILREIRQSLHNAGYTTSVIVAHAEAYGVPQLRRRLFLLGSRDGMLRWPRPLFRVSPPASVRLQPGVSEVNFGPDPITVEAAISDLPMTASSDPDTAVQYSRPAASQYQQWARGEIDLCRLMSRPKPLAPEPSLFDIVEPA